MGGGGEGGGRGAAAIGARTRFPPPAVSIFMTVDSIPTEQPGAAAAAACAKATSTQGTQVKHALAVHTAHRHRCDTDSTQAWAQGIQGTNCTQHALCTHKGNVNTPRVHAQAPQPRRTASPSTMKMGCAPRSDSTWAAEVGLT